MLPVLNVAGNRFLIDFVSLHRSLQGRACVPCVGQIHVRSRNDTRNLCVFNENGFAGQPVEVGITMYVLSISSLSEVQMVFYIRSVPT